MVSETRVQPVAAVAAPEVVAAVGTAAVVLARTAAVVGIVTAVAVAEVVPGRPAADSTPVAMAVQPPQQVVADESSFLTARALVIRPRLGTSQLAEMLVHHVMRAGTRAGPSGQVATRVGSSVIKRSI